MTTGNPEEKKKAPVARSAAEKHVHKSRKRHLRNKAAVSEVKTNITKAETLILSGKTETMPGAVANAVRSLDKAAESGIIHRNNAARRKSRLLKKLNRASAQPAAGTKK